MFWCRVGPSSCGRLHCCWSFGLASHQVVYKGIAISDSFKSMHRILLPVFCSSCWSQRALFRILWALMWGEEDQRLQGMWIPWLNYCPPVFRAPIGILLPLTSIWTRFCLTYCAANARLGKNASIQFWSRTMPGSLQHQYRVPLLVICSR